MGWQRARTTANAAVRWFVLIVCVLWWETRLAADPWAAPSGYYNAASGTGTLLKQQLTSIMSSGHIQRQYGEFRYSAAIHDQDPNNPDNILLVYNRASVPAAWDTGATWNREHVWPDSRQPGSATNTTRMNLGDPHALRPINPSINSSRGNKPFAMANTSGSYGSVGQFWFPGDADKGDVARSLFYSDTRWSSLGLTLIDDMPSGFQMGDLASLVAWHYLDTPDEFERRRNHTIYSQDYNPDYYSNNRNAYVDRPETVWSVYVNQQNDSSITVAGGVALGNAATHLNLDLGAIIVGAAVPSPHAVTINKVGNDGTYFEVRALGDATSSISGRYNAFPVGGPESRSMIVGLDTTTSVAGLRTGTIVLDNLDVTTEGGPGRGAHDADDVIQLQLSVLDHASPSFAMDTGQSSMLLDFGNVALGSTSPSIHFELFNLEATGNFTARLELDEILGFGAVEAFDTTLETFGGDDALMAGYIGRSFTVSLLTEAVGAYSATYVLQFSDEDLPGAVTASELELHVIGNVQRRKRVDSDNAMVRSGHVVVPEPTWLGWSLVLLMLRRASSTPRMPVVRV